MGWLQASFCYCISSGDIANPAASGLQLEGVSVPQQLRGGFEAFLIDIIELHRGHRVAAGEPFIEVDLAATWRAKGLARGGGGFLADGARGHNRTP